MKLRFRIIFSLFAALVLAGCVMNKLDNSPQTIVLKEAGSGGIEINVTTGADWASRMQAGPFIFNVIPQMAIWLEDESGRYIETLYVTGADFKKLRHAGKNSGGPAFFSDCLPYWASRVKASGGTLPSKENPYPDTMTSATPMGDFTIETGISGAGKTLRLYAELNKSDDTNAVFTKDNNDWAGQPSLVYTAELADTMTGKSYFLKIAGHGGMLEDDPGIYTDLSGIDTALNQIEKITVRY